MTKDEPDDQWHGFAEFVGIEDNTWTPKRVKELLRGLIDDGFIYSVPPVVLESFLNRKGLLHLTNNRHEDFFKNLAQKSRTEGGRKAIEGFANSGSEVTQPPDLEPYGPVPALDPEKELPKDTSFTGVIVKDDDDQKQHPKVVEQILRESVVLDSITDDEIAMKFYLSYVINSYWKAAFDDEKHTVKTLVTAGKTNNKFRDTAIGTFLKEYDSTKKLKIPNDYDFRHPKTKKLIEPFLMQLYIESFLYKLTFQLFYLYYQIQHNK